MSGQQKVASLEMFFLLDVGGNFINSATDVPAGRRMYDEFCDRGRYEVEVGLRCTLYM